MSSLPPELDFTADPAATPARMDRAMAFIAAGLRRAESFRPDYEAAIERLRAIGLERLDAVLSPIFVDAQGIAARLGAIEGQWLTAEPLQQLLATLEAQALLRLAEADATLQAAQAAVAGIGIGSTVQAHSNGLDALAAAELGAFGLSFIAAASITEGRSKLRLGSIATFAEATAAEYRAATATRALSAAKVWEAAEPVGLVDAPMVAVDCSAFINGTLTIAGNRVLGAPTNLRPGAWKIEIRRAAPGNFTLAYASAWSFGGTAPALSTTDTIDVLRFEVLSNGKVDAYLSKGR